MPRRAKTETPLPTNTRLSQLLQQIEKLKQEAEAIKRKEVAEVIERIREAIRYYGISAKDLGLSGKPSSPKTSGSSYGKSRGAGVLRKGSAIRYADGNGNSWSGFGPRPRWLKEALANGVQIEALTVRVAKG
jgi:DNA-binding protein H-NS